MKTQFWLGSASALAIGLCLQTAQAAAPTVIYGGGGSSPAKVYRDLFNCFSSVANGLYATTPGNPAAIAYPTGPSSACTSQGTANDVIAYEPVNATAGLAAFTAASPVPLGSPSTTNTIAYLDATAGVSATPYPEIQFAGSDVYLTSTQAAQAQAAAGEPIFQIPTFVTPFALPVGQTQNVKLTTADVCNLFAGATSKSKAGVVFSEIVYRSDGGGASFVLSDWLAQNCPAQLGFNAANGFPSVSPNWTAVAAMNGNNITFVGVKGSGGEASTVAQTANALGYVTVDYVYPLVPSVTAYPAYLNGYLPSVANVQLRLGKTIIPTSYNAATIGQSLNDQLVAPGGKGYSLISFSFIDAYQCYSKTFAGGVIGGPAQGKALLNAVSAFYGAQGHAVVQTQGFVPAATAVVSLLKTSGAPLNKTSGLQNASCPKS